MYLSGVILLGVSQMENTLYQLMNKHLHASYIKLTISMFLAIA